MNILIKLSGEFFGTKDELTEEGFNFIAQLKDNNITSGYFVVGGGNRVRGKNASCDRNISDKLGVLSTIMNAYVLKEQLRIAGLDSVIYSHFNDFGMKYDQSLVINDFNSKKFVILASGLGTVGYISTDLSSVIKSLELKTDAMIKVTKVDGIYDKDPTNKNANFINNISYEDVLKNKLNVMDLPAVAIAAENNLSIGVCSIENFSNFLNKKGVGSIIGFDWRKYN